jgi:glycosyltransferase involved in cell wall biosynthesis
MHVLMVTYPVPGPADASTMAPIARQIESLRAIGVVVDVLEVTGIPKLKYLQTLPALWARVRRVDLVHAHYGYYGWLARMQFRKPVVISFMGSDLLGALDAKGRQKPLSKATVEINRRVARMVDAVIVKSDEMAEVVAPAPAYVVPNGVDLQVFFPMARDEAREKMGWSSDKRRVLFAGSPDNARKGFPLAHDAVTAAAESLGETLELVPLTGITHDQVPLYMNACDVMIMTSLHEGSPNVVKEAMACNLPVVSVPVGDVPELLDGIEGCTICPRDAQALATALAGALSCGGQRTRGRSVLKEKGLDLENVARRVAQIYAEVLTQHDSQAAKEHRGVSS